MHLKRVLGSSLTHDESPELLMTMSMANIPVLHSKEVMHLYPQDVFPFLPRVV
jgi:hypothetical protein